MNGAIAAGHPLTAAAGARVLEEGGNAVDACVAAAFASWVAESPLTGPGAGGFCLVRPAGSRPARVADFFVSAPGIDARSPARPMHAVDVGFGAASDTTQAFHIGEPSVALSREGVEMTDFQAELHRLLDPILRHLDEGRRVYSRGDGGPFRTGDVLRLRDLGDTIAAIGTQGARVFYEGELADRMVA